MITTDFTYIFLNLLMLMIFIFAGIGICKDKHHYWSYAIWPILAFTIVLGFRLNRGNDYIHYMDVYLYDLEESQVLFTEFNHFLKTLGVGPHGIFVWYSGAFILGAMFFLKTLKQFASWIFPLFMMSFIFFSEYMIRQAFGYTFVFLFMLFMFKEEFPTCKRYICMFICFYLAYSIHSANAITCIIDVVLYYFIKVPFSTRVTIPAYLVASFYLQNNFDFTYLEGLLSFLGDQSDKFSTYTDNADIWFDSESKNAIYDRNSIVKILQTLGECSLIYLGNRALHIREDKRIVFMYNLFVLGAIVSQCFYSLEILRRMGDVMYWYWAFPLAYVLFYRKEIFSTFKYRFISSSLYLFLLFYGYDYLKYLFMRTLDMYKFIWDM